MGLKGDGTETRQVMFIWEVSGVIGHKWHATSRGNRSHLTPSSRLLTHQTVISNPVANLKVVTQCPYPGTPPASMWLAKVTSWDHTSYCHFCRPITPQRTFPECTPTRMLMSTPVASLTFLKTKKVTSPSGNGLFLLYLLADFQGVFLFRISQTVGNSITIVLSQKVTALSQEQGFPFQLLPDWPWAPMLWLVKPHQTWPWWRGSILAVAFTFPIDVYQAPVMCWHLLWIFLLKSRDAALYCHKGSQMPPAIPALSTVYVPNGCFLLIRYSLFVSLIMTLNWIGIFKK